MLLTGHTSSCYRSRVNADLVSWIRYSLTESRHAGEDVISRFRPDEWSRCVVRECEIVADRRLQRASTAVRSALDLFVSQHRKPALDKVEPGGTGRRKVHVESGVAREPATDPHGLVRPVVVEDEMHVEIGRRGCINRVEKSFKLLTAMAPMTFPDHLPGGRAENAFFRYTSIIGDGLRARSPSGQGSEAVLACHVLNRMRDLGRPASYAIRR